LIKEKKHYIETRHITNLIKSSFYFTNDLYEYVHEIASGKMNDMPQEMRASLKQIVSDHGRIKNSPFI
jgi:hypothetical protein